MPLPRGAVVRRAELRTALLCAWFCAQLGSLAGPVRAEGRLLVSAAVSLKPALAEVARVWSRSRPGVELELNAGGSAILLQQIRRGAPVDLFLSASPVEIDRLEQDGLLLPGARRVIASNELVLVVPHGGALPESVEDLREPRWRRIAIGNPRTAPVGRYARDALARADLWEPLQPRLVLGENARQVLDYVARGEVAVGLVYRTDAILLPDRVHGGPPLPPGPGGPVRYEAAVPRDAPNPRLALELLELLVSDRGRRILRGHGFLVSRMHPPSPRLRRAGRRPEMGTHS